VGSNSDLRNRTVVTVISKIADHAASTKDACLVVIYGGELGKKYSLDRPFLLIGRSSKCDIQVDQDAVSRNHAKIINTGKSILLRDLGSTNGSYVNDQVVHECHLQDGDRIKIGRTIFKFLSGDNIENAYHEEIYRLTTVDGLTQVFNKRYLTEALEREISRAHRYGRPLSIIMFDLDHFKQVNDTYGHLAGDSVLRSVADNVKRSIRREDMLGRYGGEEFLILLPEIDNYNARLAAEKLRRVVERAVFTFEETKIPVTISMGVATVTPEITDPSEFVKLVDGNLYKAKGAGRNCVVG
jgi:diguanylate cyclase (GGDEF)-like protein